MDEPEEYAFSTILDTSYEEAVAKVTGLKIMKSEELRNVAEEVSRKLKSVIDRVAKG
jgi:hypothetical protein